MSEIVDIEVLGDGENRSLDFPCVILEAEFARKALASNELPLFVDQALKAIGAIGSTHLRLEGRGVKGQQNPKALTKALLAEREKPSGRCMYCGWPAVGGNVCQAHSDLVKGVRA